MNGLLVVIGAAFGAPLRLLVSRRVAGETGTLVVNVLGSLLIGVFAGLSGRWFALLGVGFCGAFTTYSTFAVEAMTLRGLAGVRFVVLSVGLCCAACGLGLLLA